MIYKETKNYTLHLGNSLEVLDTIEENSVDSIVCDPPYELINSANKSVGFQNTTWDATGIAYSVDLWSKTLRVLKPGGYLLAFGAPRTFHRMACAIEDAGYEIRDTIMWLYGCGFPKSHDVGKEFEAKYNSDIYKGYGTSLKPAYEPIIMARKPINKNSTIVSNMKDYGTGAINIDECRIGDEHFSKEAETSKANYVYRDKILVAKEYDGRFPANIILSNDDEIRDHLGGDKMRFFYTIKASTYDRDEGLANEVTKIGDGYNHTNEKTAKAYGATPVAKKNFHPCVKPTDLMRYLVRLVTRRGGVCLDPFCGSGSTGKACMLEDRDYYFVGIEMTAEYLPLEVERIDWAICQPKQQSLF